MWTTGEDLRHPADNALAARLAKSGALDINGLQGNGTWAIRRDDEPPLDSYFIDYFDSVPDVVPDAAARGHMGDIAIERQCSPAQRASLRTGGLQPGGGLPPVGSSPPGPGNPPNKPPPPPTIRPVAAEPGQVRRAGTQDCGSCSRPNVLIGGVCCSLTQLAANGACSNSSCPAGADSDSAEQFLLQQRPGLYRRGRRAGVLQQPARQRQCPTPTTAADIDLRCATGYVPIGNSCCLASQVTSTGICCPAGQTPSGPNKSQCEKIIIVPITPPMCCAPGRIPTVGGQCCVASTCDDRRRVLRRAGRSGAPQQLRKADPARRMRHGLYEDARWIVLQRPICRRRRQSCRTGLPSRPVAPLIPLVPGGPAALPDRARCAIATATVFGRRLSVAHMRSRGTIRLAQWECVRRAGALPAGHGTDTARVLRSVGRRGVSDLVGIPAELHSARRALAAPAGSGRRWACDPASFR